MKSGAAYLILATTLVISAGRLVYSTVRGEIDYQRIVRPIIDGSFDFRRHYRISDQRDALSILGVGVSLVGLVGLGVSDIRRSVRNRQEEPRTRIFEGRCGRTGRSYESSNCFHDE
jgi:hypothetical protein